MIYKANIHKNKIYIKPRPKKDIKEGLVLILNRPRKEGVEPFIATDIYAGQKEYELPTLPEGFFIVNYFVKNEKKNKTS